MKKILLSLIIFFICFFIFSNIAFSQDLKVYAKDPQLALILSAIDPGFGQFYIGNPSLGMLFWTIDKVLFVSTILSIFDIYVTFPADLGLSVKLSLRDITTERIIYISILSSAFIGFRIFSAIFTRNGALIFNKELLEGKLYLLHKKDFSLYFYCDEFNYLNFEMKIFI